MFILYYIFVYPQCNTWEQPREDWLLGHWKGTICCVQNGNTWSVYCTTRISPPASIYLDLSGGPTLEDKTIYSYRPQHGVYRQIKAMYWISLFCPLNTHPVDGEVWRLLSPHTGKKIKYSAKKHWEGIVKRVLIFWWCLTPSWTFRILFSVFSQVDTFKILWI